MSQWTIAEHFSKNIEQRSADAIRDILKDKENTTSKSFKKNRNMCIIEPLNVYKSTSQSKNWLLTTWIGILFQLKTFYK